MTKPVLSDVVDLSLASKGRLKIEWAGRQMPTLAAIKRRFTEERPLKGMTIGCCLHVTAETACLMQVLQVGGARPFLCASNPLSTQDEVAASLVKHFRVAVFAKRGEDEQTYYRYVTMVLSQKPQMTMDDGGDLIAALHKLEIRSASRRTKFKIKNEKGESWNFYGSSEETTTGVIRLRAMEQEGALKVPVMAVNDSKTKYMFDNRYGTGQSTIDGILRATNVLLAGQNFVVAGYGWCGRGIAWKARGMGAKVIVCEVDPVKALEATMDGFQVMRMNRAVREGDIFVTATGSKSVININHLIRIKDGAIVANAGHFNVEVDFKGLERICSKKREVRPNVCEYQLKGKKRIYLLAEGRLVNLSSAEGHPAAVMDMSFANQALAAEYFVVNQGKLKNKVYCLPEELDRRVARLKLKGMGINFDKLTREQRKYLSSWKEGT